MYNALVLTINSVLKHSKIDIPYTFYKEGNMIRNKHTCEPVINIPPTGNENLTRFQYCFSSAGFLQAVFFFNKVFAGNDTKYFFSV